MDMNSKQYIVLFASVIVVVGMMLYPPFHITIKGAEINMGYGFLFDSPKIGYLDASVNIPVLLTQWVAVILVGAVGWFLSKGDGSLQITEPRERNPENKSVVESTSFVLLRLMRGIVGWHVFDLFPVLENTSFVLLRLIRGIVGFIFGWQVIGLFSVLTWFSNPSAITGYMVAMVVLKIVIMVVTGAVFFGLRKYIHWLHKRWYGVPHPALSKALAL